MKRVLVFTVVLFMLVLTACSNQSEAPPKSSSSSSSSTVTTDTPSDNMSELAKDAEAKRQLAASGEVHIPTSYDHPIKSDSNKDWEYDVYDFGVAVTEYIGNKDVTNLVIPDKIENKNVVYAGSELATNLENLQSVEFSDNIIGIGSNLFTRSKNLNQVELPDNLQEIKPLAFQYCENLTDIEFPESLTKIGSFAFSNTGLEIVFLPERLQEIGQGAFSNCEDLSEVYFRGPIEHLPDSVFQTCRNLYTIGGIENVVSIGTNAFSFCERLDGIYLDKVETIGNGAFQRTAVSTLELPEGLKTIGDHAFDSCYDLYDISLPSTLQSIGTMAFFECTSFEYITIPGSVKEIGKSAFSGCISLQLIDIEEGVETIGEKAFVGCHDNLEVYLPMSIRNAVEAFSPGVIIHYAGTKEELTKNGSITVESTNNFTLCPLQEDMTQSDEDINGEWIQDDLEIYMD